MSKIKNLSKKELEKLLEEKRNKLYQVRFDISQKKIKNVREIREIKKDIARINTLISEDKLKMKSERK